MLLTILMQAAAGAAVGKLGAAIGAGLAVIGAGYGIEIGRASCRERVCQYV